MSNKQFIIGDTNPFGDDLNNKDGVTLVGYIGISNKNLAHILAAASEAKHKDGIVHIDALTLQTLMLDLLERRSHDDRACVAIGGRYPTPITRSDDPEMLVALLNAEKVG